MKQRILIALSCITAVGFATIIPLIAYLKPLPPSTPEYQENLYRPVEHLAIERIGHVYSESGKQNTWVDFALAKLAICESGNRPDIFVLDTNGKYSYGLYMYQALTWIKYYKIHVADGQDPMKSIMSRETQAYVTRRVLETEGKKALAHWRNCSTKLALL